MMMSRDVEREIACVWAVGKFVKGQVAQNVPMDLEKNQFGGYGWKAPGQGQGAEPRRNPQDQILENIRKKSRL